MSTQTITVNSNAASETTNDQTPITPFDQASITDNTPQTETLTVTLSAAADGTLSNPLSNSGATGTYNASTGTYTDTGNLTQINADLAALVFTPTPGQAPLGTQTPTTFTVTVTGADNTTTSDATTTVTTTAEALPTITGTSGSLSTTDHSTITPFSTVVIGDTNVNSPNENVTISLSSPANGALNSSVGGTYNAATGEYTVSGSASAVTAAIQALVFTPATGSTAGDVTTTGFSITDVDTNNLSANPDTTTSVSATTVVPSTISGVTATENGNDLTPINPFTGVTIGDANPNGTETVTVTLSSTTNGTLSGLGTGISGTYTVTGTAAQVTAALDAATFTPAIQGTPGTDTFSTTFTISDHNSVGLTTPNATTTLDVASVVAPTITGSSANQPVTDQGTVSPFTSITITDANTGPQTESITVTPSQLGNGSFTTNGHGTYNPISGVYTDSGTAAQVTTDLRALVFTPTAHEVAPGQTVATAFTISDTDTAGVTVNNNTSSVIATASSTQPTITGTSANQTSDDQSLVHPFTNVAIHDVNYGQTEHVTITLSNHANGTLNNVGTGAYNAATGIFTDTGSVAQVNSDIAGLEFAPTVGQVPPGQTVTTTFGISDTDTANLTVSDNTTSLVVTAVALPTIIGTTASQQQVSDHGTITPFSGVTITDANPNQTEALSVTLTPSTNGTLTSPANHGSYNAGTGVYTDTGSAAAITADLDALVFTPTPGQGSVGSQFNSGLTISVHDTAGQSATDATTTILTTDVAAPTITGATINQPVTDQTTINPFTGVTVTDPNSGQTETVTVSFLAANGVLSHLGTGTQATTAGTTTYTATGSAAVVTADLQNLTFAPTAHQVAPGGTTTTTFIIGDTDTASASAPNATASVVATAVAVAPTITGTLANQPVTDQTTVNPFTGVTVADANFGQTETVTVSFTSANGSLSHLGTGTQATTAGTTTYTATGTAAVVSADLQNLTFTPTAHQVAPGSTKTTAFTIGDTDTAAATATNASTSVVATAVAVPPTITGATINQPVTDQSTVSPFTGVTIADANFGQTETVSVTFASANGTLSHLGNGTQATSAGATTYTDTGTAAAITSDLQGLIFTPTAHQVAPGGTTTTTFIIGDTDTAAATATNATASVVATAVAVAPTITGALPNQATTDLDTINPFTGVTITDTNFGQTETVSVTFASANGTLSHLGTGTQATSAGTTTYTDTGTAAAVSADLQNLTFTPTAHQVTPGSTTTTTFTIGDTDTAGAVATTDATTSVIATAGTVAPIVSGTLANQPITDQTTVNPFAGVTVVDPNFGQIESIAVTLSAPANGTLSHVLHGFYNAGVLVDTGSAAQITSDLQALVFTPTAQEVAPGQTVTTTFSITGSDTAGAHINDSTTSVIATAGTVLPTITGTLANQPTTDLAAVNPFTGVTVADINFGQTETVTVSFASANGALSHLGNGTVSTTAGTTTYNATGSAAAVSADLQNLSFTPTAHQVAPGSTTTTTFNIGDTDTAGAHAAAPATTASVIATATTALPTITGTLANQPVTDQTTVNPFTGVTVADVNFGQTETVTVSFASANGALSHLGTGTVSTTAGTSTYTDIGTATAITADLHGLVFTPTAHQVAPGGTKTTTFTIGDTDTAGAHAAAPATTTSVVATATTALPTIIGAVADQSTDTPSALQPLGGIVIGDVNFGQTETVTVQLSDPLNGSLSHLSGGHYDAESGLYTDSGSAAAVTTALQNLVFTPTAYQVAPGASVTTTFTVGDTDTAGASATDNTTSVIATAGTTVPTIAGTIAGQTVDAPGTITPFANVAIADVNIGQTETVTVTLSAAANGVLTHLGGGSYDATTGVYTDTGSAIAVTAALAGLVFTPTSHQVVPGETVTTGFTVADTDSAGASAMDDATTVIATAGTLAPTITGTALGQTVSSEATITPFSRVVIADLNIGQTETVTVTMSAAADGALTNIGAGNFDAATGVYTDTGTAAAVTADLRGLVFTPTAGMVSPGHNLTTTFTIADTDTAGASATTGTSSIVVQAPVVAPEAEFDPAYYLANNPDVAAAGIDPETHYDTVGWLEGRNPDPYFNTAYYLRQNPDVAAAGINPLLHYETSGWQEGRDPSINFSTKAYLTANPDVAAAHIDPLMHYLEAGRAEGRMNFIAQPHGTGPQDPLVDSSYYFSHYSDVAAAGVDPTAHYDASGWKEGRNPDAYFDTAYYLQQNPDVAAAGINPLLHYEDAGWKEGRNPSAAFSTSQYLSHNPDVAAAGIDPLVHYLQAGAAEGRAIYSA